MRSFQNQFIKTLGLLGFLCLSATVSFAQNESRPSPAKEASGKIGDVTVTINYSSPGVKGRTVWGELVPYGEVWRTGANEATVIKFDQPVLVEGKKLDAGEYALFTIPEKDEWTIIFNKEPKQWGAFKYDASKDALRVKVKPAKSDKSNERMLFEVKGKDRNAGNVVLLWENLMVPVSIKPAK